MISILFLILAAVSSAVCDTLKSTFSTSIFSKLNPKFWDPNVSWVNKWAVGSTTKERFLGSSTIFVFVTDAYHLFKEIMILGICFAIATDYIWIVNTFVNGLILMAVWGISFQIAYVLFNKKKIGSSL